MILVFGRTGQLATALGAHPGVTLAGRDAADLTDPQACADLITQTRASAIINAAAYTAVDRAEDEPELAHWVNAEAPGAMAQAAAARALPFVHVSTDYVFDGTGDRPWRETDNPAPVSVYGRSKLAGEHAIAGAGGTYAILRTAWVVSATGANFVKTMLRLGESRDTVRVVDDQRGGPTPADDLAAACLTVVGALTRETSGIYHFAGAPAVSWAGFAREIFAQAGKDVTVDAIPSEQYPTPAPRPLNSVLDCTKIGATFGIEQPDWRQGLARILGTLKETA